MIQLIRNLFLPNGLALALLLAGCGESTNIEGNNGSSVQSCASLLEATCVSGRLIDDAAFNVDYECGVDGGGTVRAVTDVDGGFSCPTGSVVNFFLDNPDSNDESDRIDLGSVTVVRPAQIFGDSPTANPVYFYVTPRMLAGDGAGNGFSSRARNIARLLQTLSSDLTDLNQAEYLPTRRVIITDDDKRKITAAVLPDTLDFTLSPATDPAMPADGTFDAEIHDYLATLADTRKHQLISDDEALVALEKGAFNVSAGIYLVPGGSVLSTGSFDPASKIFNADTGAMVGLDIANSKQFVGSFYMLVDRRGRTISHGVYSYGAPAPSENWSVWSDPQAMQLTQTGYTQGALPLWPMDQSLTQVRMALLGASDAGKYVQLTQGNIRRQAVAGSAAIYLNLFEETSAPTALGQWNMVDGSGTTTFVSNGAFTLDHFVAVAPLMNPDLWKPSVVEFPLPITVTLYNQDYDNVACKEGPVSRGCKIADIRMVILEDGNIISDRYGSCGAKKDPLDATVKFVNRKTLYVNDDSSKQEIPLGVVANMLDVLKDETNSSLKTMTLLAMLPQDARLNDTISVVSGFESYIPFSQFGSNVGANSLLRVDGIANKFQMYGVCTETMAALGICNTVDAFQPKTATWLNGYTFMKAIKANKTAPSATLTQELIENSGGTMAAQRTPSCP